MQIKSIVICINMVPISIHVHVCSFNAQSVFLPCGGSGAHNQPSNIVDSRCHNHHTHMTVQHLHEHVRCTPVITNTHKRQWMHLKRWSCTALYPFSPFAIRRSIWVRGVYFGKFNPQLFAGLSFTRTQIRPKHCRSNCLGILKRLFLNS